MSESGCGLVAATPIYLKDGDMITQSNFGTI